MNNKGYLLVEIIVASVLAMTIMYFLVELTINLKNINDDYYVETKLETDQILMIENVMNDLSSYSLKKIAVDSNTVNFTFNDGTNDINKRITIEENKFKYGTINDDGYINDDIYVKSFDEKLNVEDIKIENLCYVDNSYVDCSSAPNATKGLLKITIPAFTIYSDINYGISLNIPYNVKEVSIYIPKEPIISSKGNNFTITKGEDHNIIDEYFTYDTNGGKEITSKKCLVNNTDEVTNTSELNAGSFNISCTVTNGDNLSASASTTLTVELPVKNLYYGTLTSGSGSAHMNIYRCSDDFSDCTFVASPAGMINSTPSSISPQIGANDDYWYYSGCNYGSSKYINTMTVYRCQNTDCNSFASAAGYIYASLNISISMGIVSNNEYMYYSSSAMSSSGLYIPKMTLYRCKVDGTDCKSFASAQGFTKQGNGSANGTGNNFPPSLAATDKYFYYTSAKTSSSGNVITTMGIYRCNIDGTNCEQFASANGCASGDGSELYPVLAADNNYVYYTNSDNYTNSMSINRCNADGSDCKQISSTAGYLGYGTSGVGLNPVLAINDKYLYYTKTDYSSSGIYINSLTLYKCNRDGTNCEAKKGMNGYINYGPGIAPTVVANNNYVYYTTARLNSSGNAYSTNFDLYKCDIELNNCSVVGGLSGFANTSGSVIPPYLLLTK